MSDLYEEVCAWYNLYMAWLGAARGKRGREPAARFEYHLEDNLLQLQEELQGQTYRPGPYDSFYIHEPKRRLISAAPFRDRVVHHALCNVIGPPFERRFIADSYANRLGKGTHRALDFYERITEANGRKGKERLEKLRQADVALDKVRHYLRLAARWKWLSGGQYRHAAAMAAEVGRLLGGWIKQTIDALGKTM